MQSAAAGAAGTRAGLSSAEARRRLAEAGPNSVSPPRHRSLPARAVRQLVDPMLLLLCGAAALTLAIRDFTDAAVVLAVVVNTTIGVVHEIRADRAVTALARLASPRARLVRDGLAVEVAAADVVPGDLLMLAAGELVAADATVVEQSALLVAESSLTGESMPVAKVAAGAGVSGAPCTDRVKADTAVLRGRGHALVTATGPRSALGSLGRLVDAAPPMTPLQLRLRDLSRLLALAGVTVCAAVAALGRLRGQPLAQVVVTAISLVVAAVPESLPAVITVSFAMGAHRMAARRDIVRPLPAVETLGAVATIELDETGTLTEGTMAVEWVWTPAGPARLDDASVAESSMVDPAVRELLGSAATCTDTVADDAVEEAGGAGSLVRTGSLGDPLERALIMAMRRPGRAESGRARTKGLLPGDESPCYADMAVPSGTGDSEPGHVKRWRVDLFLYEGKHSTSAQAVLHGDAAAEPKSYAVARRRPGDPDIPEIGDEIAAARALRRMADLLLTTASADLQEVTGRPAIVAG